MIDFEKYLEMQAAQHKSLIEAGIAIGEQKFQWRVRALDAAYRQASLDPETKIPSYLEAAIFSLLLLMQESVNVYADSMIKRDKEVPQWERDARTGARDIPVGQ